MQLTPHQQDIFEKIMEALRGGHKRIVLKGAAGVGKTTLAREIILAAQADFTINANQYNNGCVYVTAPTNKALSVIQSKVPAKSGIIFKTVHSALKLKRIILKNGDAIFIQAYSLVDKKEDFKDCKIAFVDESSMVNSEILKHLDQYNFPIVFIGDKYQINPVGELITPVFERNYLEFELTEIIRQGEGNPIIALSRDIDMIFFKSPKVVNGKGYIYNDNLDLIIDKLAEANGTDEIKYLAWTNVQIDAINAEVRRRIYGEPKRVELGEVLVFNSPLEAYFTNKEVKVETLEIVTGNVPVPRFTTRYDGMNKPITATDQIKMKYYRINNSFNIVHEHSDIVFKDIAKSIKECCTKYKWSWKAWHFFTEQSANVKYNHAISVHKSQGSTYKVAVLNVENINYNPSAEEKQRLFYTGVTRASDLVILNNVP